MVQKQVSIPTPAAEPSRDSGLTRKLPPKPQSSDIAARLEQAEKQEKQRVKEEPTGCGCW